MGLGFRGFVVALCLFFNALALAADPALLQKRFQEHFRAASYVCGVNCINFIRRIHGESKDGASLFLVKIENRGFSVFGMVNAEMARDSLRGKPATLEVNWYHHYVVVDDRGLVYDFSFTTEPRILPFAEYVEKMFLDEPAAGRGGQISFRAGRDRKLDDYVLTVMNGVDVLRNDAETPHRTFRLRELFENWRRLLPSSCASRMADLPLTDSATP